MSQSITNNAGKTIGSDNNNQTKLNGNNNANIASNNKTVVKNPENNSHASDGERDQSQVFRQNFSTIISVIALIVAIWSASATYWTAEEAKKTRIESHKAVIAANPVEESMAVKFQATKADIVKDSGEDGKIDNYVTGYAMPLLSSQGEMTHEIISLSDLRRNPVETPIQFVNIGPGMAINVKFIWDDENVNKLYHALLKANNEADKYVLNVNDETYFKYSPSSYYEKEESLLSDIALKIHPDNTEYSYMRFNLAEVYTVGLPISYSILFSDILLHDPLAKPSVKLTIEFSDTQGTEYYELITLTASNPSAMNIVSEDGSEQAQPGITYTINTNHSTPVRK